MSEDPSESRRSLELQELRNQQGQLIAYQVPAAQLDTLLRKIDGQTAAISEYFPNAVSAVAHLCQTGRIDPSAASELYKQLLEVNDRLRLSLDFSALAEALLSLGERESGSKPAVERFVRKGKLDADEEVLQALKGQTGPPVWVPASQVTTALEKLEQLAATGQATAENVQAAISESLR